MNKREFMIQYVLNRASGKNSGSLDGGYVARAADEAWTVITTNSVDPETFQAPLDNKKKK